MEWKFRSDQPIYTQLVEQLTQAILSGAVAPGERLPAVRDLAMRAGVNPNTMQRAMAELEQRGLIYAQRTSGRFVTDNAAVIRAARDHLARQEAAAFAAAMARMGYHKEQVLQLLREEEEF